MNKFGNIEGFPLKVLHLWYPLNDIQEMIDRRTSLLGNYRRTEETSHLLDLIRMSKDETDLFNEFAEEAMVDVFKALSKHTMRLPFKAYNFDQENGDEFDNSFHFILFYPPSLSHQFIEPLDVTIKRAIVFHIIYNWIQEVYPDEAERWANKYAVAIDSVMTQSTVMMPPITHSVGRWF